MPRSFRAPAAAAALALALLAACSESPTGPGATTSPDAAAPGVVSAAAAFTMTGCDGAAVALTADEKRTVDLHNATRRAYGLPEFCVHATLTAAARAHSREMLEHGFLSHDSFDGRPFNARIVGFGYTQPYTLAENAGWGSGTLGEADHIFDRWMDSDSHRPHILDAGLREIGVGVVWGTYRTYGGTRMYTVDFGTR
jgi:uncharacterized protein YkwD